MRSINEIPFVYVQSILGSFFNSGFGLAFRKVYTCAGGELVVLLSQHKVNRLR